MSKTATALLIKFAMTFIVAAASFAILEENSWGWVALLAVAVTALNYFLGDLFILPRFGNIVAAVSDGILGAITAAIIAAFVPDFRVTLATLALFAILLAIGEFFLHKYLRRSEKVEP
ncbi:MAG: DUF2512 family protein [Bacillota bacterium]